MNVVVFGGSGYIGQHIIPYLVRAGHRVTVVGVESTCRAAEGDGVVYRCADITDAAAVDALISGAQIVYNFAAIANIQTCLERPADAIRVNILGAHLLLEACVRHGVSRYIQASSVYAYSKSGGLYSVTKRCVEDLVLYYHATHRLPFTILRYGTIYGPEAGQGNSLLGYIEQAVQHRKIVYPGSGEELREYIHIDDAVRLSVRMLDGEFENQIMLISGLHPYTVRDVLETIREMMNHSVELEFQNEGRPHHYTRTPYSFFETTARKITNSHYIDIQQGLMDCLQCTARRLAPSQPNYEPTDRRDHSRQSA